MAARASGAGRSGGRRTTARETILVRRRADDFLSTRDRRVPQRLAEADPELLGGDGGKRSAPLQAVGAIGRALHHLLDLLVAQWQDVGMSPGRVGERRTQALEQCVTAPVGDALRG